MQQATAEEQLLHSRNYEVQSFRVDDTRIRLRGRVTDVKPPGMYLDDDPDPLTVHNMVVEMVVQLPTLEIVEAGLVMETHPHGQCTDITNHYERLVGLSIARGYTHKIRELFGGPRGCTHTTALLQAMAPVAIQSIWSMTSFEDGTPVRPPLSANPTEDEVRERFAHNLNTCHVWAEDGPQFTKVLAGEELEPPIWAVDRLEALGRDPEDWITKMRGESRD